MVFSTRRWERLLVEDSGFIKSNIETSTGLLRHKATISCSVSVFFSSTFYSWLLDRLSWYSPQPRAGPIYFSPSPQSAPRPGRAAGGWHEMHNGRLKW